VWSGAAIQWRLSWGVSTLLAALCAASLTHAQEGDARARQAAAEAYDQGTSAYVAKDFEKAAQWFETANRLSPAAPALIQGARAHFKAGNLPRAATLALQLTRAYGSEPAALDVGNGLLDEISHKLLRVDVSCEGCTLDVGGTLQEFASFFLPPNEAHTVTASFETGERSSEVSGSAGETKTLSFEAPPQTPTVVGPSDRDPTTPDEPPPDDGTEPRDISKKPLPPIVTYIGAGVTVALLAVSIASTVDVFARADKYEEAADVANRACMGGAANCRTLHDSAEKMLVDGEPYETRTTVLWIVTGAVGAATGIIALTLTDWSDDEDDDSGRARLRIEPALDPVHGSAGLRLGAQF
jgi:hypothetical protein